MLQNNAGIIVPQRDLDSLVKATQEIISSPSELVAFQQQAHISFCAHYSKEGSEMAEKKRIRYTAEEKVALIRLHLVEDEPVS